MTELSAETRSPYFTQDTAVQTYRAIHLPRVFVPWARVLLESVPPRPGEAILDVATGPGTVARQAALLVGPEGRVVGVDISAAMLAVGREWPAESGAASIAYLECSATHIPLPDGTFEVAYCQQGLQHMAEPMAALREMRRVLKPSGRLGVAVWVQSPFGLFRNIASGLGLTDEARRPSNFGRDANQLTTALREAGFSDVDVQRREQVAILEGGVPQAMQIAIATSAGSTLDSLPSAQRDAIRAALAEALQSRVQDGAVHLESSAHIAMARRS